LQALSAGRTHRTRGTRSAIRAGGTRITLRPRQPLRPGHTLGTRYALRPRCTLCSGRALHALQALGTGRSHGAVSAVRTCDTRVALGPRDTLWPRHAWCPRRPWITFRPGRPGVARGTRIALGPLQTLKPHRPRRTGRARWTRGALGSGWTHLTCRTGYALRTCRTRWPCGTLGSRGTRRTRLLLRDLAALRAAAARHVSPYGQRCERTKSPQPWRASQSAKVNLLSAARCGGSRTAFRASGVPPLPEVIEFLLRLPKPKPAQLAQATLVAHGPSLDLALDAQKRRSARNPSPLLRSFR
jgi:hypothetical protein